MARRPHRLGHGHREPERIWEYRLNPPGSTLAPDASTGWRSRARTSSGRHGDRRDALRQAGRDRHRRGTPEPGTKVVVNLFDGGPRDSVWLSLNGAPLEAMAYVVRTDPHVDRLHAQYAETDNAYGRPHRSSHIWEYRLPEGLAPGLYRVEVTSEDEFGQRRQGRFSFEVTGG